MDTNYIITELRNNKFIFHGLISNIEKDLIYWKQYSKKWCLLEIICHLYDEEREDFRARLRVTLDNPNKEFSPIDPVGWVKTRDYINQDFNSKLNNFLEEREKSITYLIELQNPKWDNIYKHSEWGDQSAKMFFSNWLAHDYLHIKQIMKLKFDYLAFKYDEKLNYAGDW